MSGPLIQNFSVPQGDDLDVNFDVGPDTGASLIGSNIVWSAFAMSFGTPTGDALIKKTTDNGLQVTDSDQLKFTVTLGGTDTLDLEGNYYHEAIITWASGVRTTVTQGLMSVTPRPTSDFTAGEIP